MTNRLLPPEEWARLTGTELEAVLPYLKADQDAHVIVVEEGDQLIGCWAVVRLWHAEGIWIHPDHRGKAGVARRLLASLAALGRSLRAPGVITAAVTDDVGRLLDKIGTKLPGTHYVMPFPKE